LLSKCIEYMEYIMEMEVSSALEHWRIKIHVQEKMRVIELLLGLLNDENL
jgi:hypothetical protein